MSTSLILNGVEIPEKLRVMLGVAMITEAARMSKELGIDTQGITLEEFHMRELMMFSEVSTPLGLIARAFDDGATIYRKNIATLAKFGAQLVKPENIDVIDPIYDLDLEHYAEGNRPDHGLGDQPHAGDREIGGDSEGGSDTEQSASDSSSGLDREEDRQNQKAAAGSSDVQVADGS